MNSYFLSDQVIKEALFKIPEDSFFHATKTGTVNAILVSQGTYKTFAGELIETTLTVPPGETRVAVTNPRVDNIKEKNTYLLTLKTFNEKYNVDQELSMENEQSYQAKECRKKCVFLKLLIDIVSQIVDIDISEEYETISIMASWGENQVLRQDAILVITDSEVYGIDGREFENTYRIYN